MWIFFIYFRRQIGREVTFFFRSRPCVGAESQAPDAPKLGSSGLREAEAKRAANGTGG